MQLIENQVDALIMGAFPQYRYEEIENWTWDKTAKIAAMAEWILNVKGLDISLQIDTNESQSMPAPPSMLSRKI